MWRGARLTCRQRVLELYCFSQTRGQARFKKSNFQRYKHLRTKSWHPNKVLPDLDPMNHVPVNDEWTSDAFSEDSGFSSIAEAPLVGQLLVRYSEQYKKVRALDICSSMGVVLNGLALRNCDSITAIEPDLKRVAISDKGMSYRHRHLENVRVLQWGINRKSKLPFESESFEYITCNYGLTRFEKPLRLFKEARRLLRSGDNIFSFSTFAPLPMSKALALLVKALERHGDPAATTALNRILKFGSPSVLRKGLRKVGFPETHISVRIIPSIWRIPSPEMFFKFLQGSAALKPILDANSPEQQSDITAFLTSQFTRDILPDGCSLVKDGSIFIRQPAVIGICQREDVGILPTGQKFPTKETWQGEFREVQKVVDSDEEEDEEDGDEDEDELEEHEQIAEGGKKKQTNTTDHPEGEKPEDGDKIRQTSHEAPKDKD